MSILETTNLSLEFSVFIFLVEVSINLILNKYNIDNKTINNKSVL